MIIRYNEFIRLIKESATPEFDSLPDDKVIAQVGNEIITKADILSNKENITQWFGEFTDDIVSNITSYLYSVQDYYNKGGVLYRVVWLKDISELDKENLGYHWIDSYMIDDIVGNFEMKMDYEGEPYIVKAETPPHNVRIASDYFNNLEEEEIQVENPKLLKFISITKYSR